MDIQEIARNTFTISALLLTATVVLLSHSWKRLLALINTLPIDNRRIRFSLGSISDLNEKDKHMYIGGQFIACIFLIISFAMALFSVFMMSGMMVGDTTGMYAKDNFELAVVLMRVGVFCLFMGAFCVGMVYLEDVAAIYRGVPAITTIDLNNLPERPIYEKAKPNTGVWIIIAYTAILGFIITLPYNQWIQMTIATIVGVVLLAVARIVNNYYWNAQKIKLN